MRDAINDFRYQPMNPAELADISRRAGHDLTEEQALAFLREETENRLIEFEFRRRTKVA